MQLHIECPICEQHITTPELPPDKKVICPSCSRKFRFSNAAKVSPPLSTEKKQTADPDRLSVPNAIGKPSSQAISDAVENPLGKTETQANQTSQSTTKHKLALQLRKKKKAEVYLDLDYHGGFDNRHRNSDWLVGQANEGRTRLQKMANPPYWMPNPPPPL